ncbi:MAG: thiamine diphosphokinase [Candidatus Thermoplasmatota archaeon]
MKVALVLNGDEPSGDDLKLLDACDAIICADGAAQSLLKTNHVPTVIVGDMDSLKGDAYKWADSLDIPIERHPERKDLLDGDLALEKARSLGATSVLVLGGHGGRSAMFLATLKMLRRIHDSGLEGSMVGRGESIRFVSAGQELPLPGRQGAILNLLAMDGDAVVSLTGTAWEGADIVLGRTDARGVSNKILSDGARIAVRSGTVLVVVERKKSEYYVL